MPSADTRSVSGACDVVFLALAKNCRRSLPQFVQMVRDLRASGLTCEIVVGENGSTDGTREFLSAVQRQGEATLVSTGSMAGVTDRLRRMAIGREFIKQHFAGLGIVSQFVCVVDLDDVMRRHPSVSAFRRALATLTARRDLFAISATSSPHYYDLLAYEDDESCFEFLLENLRAHRTSLGTYYRFFVREIYPHQRRLSLEGEHLCRSAFNGMCLYRASDYFANSYLDDNAGASRCEHLIFNRRLAATTGGRVMIAPDMIVSTPSDHRQRSLLPFAWRRIKKAMTLMPRLRAGDHAVR